MKIKKTAREPIAIVGIGCRFPKVEGPEGLWKLLQNSENAVGEIPKERIGDVEQLFNPRPATPGKMMSRFGGFLEKIELFDAEFFGIAPLEAERMDPQQRILMEVAWEALEDAGIQPSALSGSPTGVFIGSWLQDFETRLIGDPTVDDLKSIDLYTTTGSGRYPIAGRLSYFFGLQGPSMVIDTACSSSLVAIHLACQSLWQGESQMALAGGVNIILTPYITVAYSQSRMMSPDGICKFGDARADGYVRSEGCGIVVLKPLSKAISDHDPIYAVILGSAVNNDGRTSGYLTTPGQDGQEDVLRKAYRNAGISPGIVEYVEAHGTGTLAGDPVELNALGSVLSDGRRNDHPCFVGSIKTNIGHTEGAAGVAGLIKVALSLKYEEIPASLNFNDPNPNIPWDSLPLEIPREKKPWPHLLDCLRVGGVSAFGITGTNAHVVLQEAPKTDAIKLDKASTSITIGGGKTLFPISAHSPTALKETVQKVSTWLKDETTIKNQFSLDDLCATAALKREHHDFRLTVVVENINQLREGISAFLESREHPGVGYYPDRVRAKPKIVFVFPGQGSQWFGMCKKLLRDSPIFRATMEQCARALKPYTDWSLLGLLDADAECARLEEIDVVQPTLFAIQIALVAQWQSWGVEPDAVVGHSMGEPAAGYVAGILDLDGAARVISNRSRLMKRTSGRGAMAVVELTMEEARREIAGREEHLSIAVSNSPRSTVLSGDPIALDKVLSNLESRSVFCRKIKVDVASHSPQMDPLRPELVDILKTLKPRPGNIPIYSTVTGAILNGEAFDADYWGKNLRQPVRFSEVIKRMFLDKYTVFIEISPHPLLLRAIDETARLCRIEDAQDCITLPSMLRNEDELGILLSSAGKLYCLGYPLNWMGIHPEPRQRVKLPSYAWQRERCWFVEGTGKARSQKFPGRRADGHPGHPMLTRYICSSTHADLHLWETDLNMEWYPWLADHMVQGNLIFPAAAFIEMAIAATSEALGDQVELYNIEFQEALFLNRKESKLVQVVISKNSEDGFEIRILSRPSGAIGAGRPWREHAHGKVSWRNSHSSITVHNIDAIRTRCERPIHGDLHYAAMQRLQIGYGPSFRGIEHISQGVAEAVARIRPPQSIAADIHDFRIHPALIDAGLQLLVSLADGVSSDNGDQSGAWMPVRLDSVCMFASLPASDELWAVAQGGAEEQGVQFKGDLFLLDQAGHTLLEAHGIVLQKIGYTLGEDVEQWFYEMEWHSRPLAVQSNDEGFLPGPDEIVRQVAAVPLTEQLQMDAKTAAELLPELERLSIDYILTALMQLGLRFEMDRSFTADELAHRLRIHERNRRLLDRLLSFLQEEGVLKPVDGALNVGQSKTARESWAIHEQLLAQYPQCRTELTLLHRCGLHLAEALSGAVEPLELLFPRGSLEEAETFYGDSVFARTANHQAALTLQATIERLPAGRMLRILEIGAGTGGLTTHLLPVLPPERTRYQFTDLGAAFVAQAREKYKDVPWIEYGVLDIEKDPVVQGFEPNRYDIVLAANCLHATRNMRTTLAHVRRLLSPGGLMLLVEGTRSQRWIDLIFGLTEGWWLFEDRDRRPLHPLLDAEAWKTVAAEAGFTDVAVFSQTKAALFEQSIVAARTPGLVSQPLNLSDQLPDKGACLLFADQCGVGENLAGALRSRGYDCQFVYRGLEFRRNAAGDYEINPASPDHYTLVLREFEEMKGSGPRAVLYLWPLDEPTGVPQSSDYLRDLLEDLCGGLLLLAKTMVGIENDRRTRLWVVSRRALPTGREGQTISLASATLAGLVKVINLEHPELHCRAVDLDSEADSEIRCLLDELAAEDNESLTAYRDGQRLVPRVISLSDRRAVDADWHALSADQPVRLINENRGTLDGLVIREVPYVAPGPGQVAIQVRAAGLNFRDVVCTLGMIPDNDDPGLECAGRIVAVGKGVNDLAVGDDVIAVAPGAFSTFVNANAALVVPKPDGMTFEQAATLPIAFLTAYYGLFELARLKGGEKVLIHAASGGVGLAAIQLAKACGAEIFGTAGTPRKRAFLASMGVNHVLDSRSLDFTKRILDLTEGMGVDVVLNSLSGDFIASSFAALRMGGRFIEIGKRGTWTPEQVRASRPDTFYFFFDLAAMIADQPERLRPVLDLLLKKFRSEELTALPATILPMEQIVHGYRIMQQARHIGKIVVNQQPWSGGKPIDMPDAFDRRNTYLITGAFGGIGLWLTKWLFERGARHFALVGREEPSAGAMACIAELERAGAHIRPLKCDVSSQAQVESLILGLSTEMPPLRGVFHLAGALDDGALMQQSWLRFEKVLAPKVLGAWNLHRLTNQLPLDCFVLFSSWASFLGSPGQANHSAANAFLDALAWQRRSVGLPALSINWGPWAEIGAATRGDVAEHLNRHGIGSFSPQMGFRALSRLMSQGAVQVAVTPFDLKKWRRASKTGEKSTWFEYLDENMARQFDEPAEDSSFSPLLSLREALLAAQIGKARYILMEAFLKEQVAKTLRLPVTRIDSNKSFRSFGMDSLTALEFRNRIEAGTELTLSATLVWNYPTISKLASFLLEKMAESIGQAEDLAMEKVDADLATPADGNQEKLEEILDELESMSEDQVRQLLDEG
jgi:acyl transferase domain-containing protein/acyl carrier protein